MLAVEGPSVTTVFRGKRYESFFMNDSKTDCDDWIPSHGPDTLLGQNKMIKIAESDLGIEEHRDRREFAGDQ
ncbi:unnamed protein product [Phytophthora lilii]|uniref:Unnamed protein product n=1 Tax=Phytophthora lilii TaxID=2077276 RepID=A0A9W6WZL2_9STRA|nr:unnamed protein product [Phytophthora lilii]